jgi:hypothetical protein
MHEIQSLLSPLRLVQLLLLIGQYQLLFVGVNPFLIKDGVKYVRHLFHAQFFHIVFLLKYPQIYNIHLFLEWQQQTVEQTHRVFGFCFQILYVASTWVALAHGGFA